MLRPVEIAPFRPAAWPRQVIDADEIRSHLNITAADHDEVLKSFVCAAAAHIEKHIGQPILAQNWRQDFSCFRNLRLPFDEIVSVTAVRYVDTAGSLKTLDAESYELCRDDLSPFVDLADSATWPSTSVQWNAVQIEFVGGWERTPEPIRQALKLIVGHWFFHREAVVIETGIVMVQLPLAVEALLAPYCLRRHI